MEGIGTFRWWPSVDRWYWNDALFGLLGYEPRTVVPTRALLLSHAHPRDRERLADAVTDLALHHRPFRTRHRMVTEGGRTRDVVGVGGPVTDRQGPAEQGEVALLGYLIPVDADLGAAPLTGSTWPGAEVVIPVPRGRDGTPPAESVVPGEAEGAAAVPAVRAGDDADGTDTSDARHAAVLRRAHDTLVAGLDLSHEGAAALVAWLANAHEVPPVVVAESLAELDRDEGGSPDLAALLAVMDEGPGL